MASYRSPLFNAGVWLQALLAFLFCRIVTILNSMRIISSDDTTDPAWIGGLLQRKFRRRPPRIVSVAKSGEDLPGRGLVGLVYKIRLEYRPPLHEQEKPAEENPPFPRSLVVKRGKESFQARLASVCLGSAREAVFYSSLVPRHASIFARCVPEVLHSRGSLLTGEFTMVMEDLTGRAVPASEPLGNQCWGATKAEVEDAEKLRIVRAIFRTMAEINAAFWMDASLLQTEWLRNVPWRTGRGRPSWEAAFDNMGRRWRDLRGGGFFTELQRDAMDRLLAGTEWNAWQESHRSSCFTLTHGDFHAGNVLWRQDETEKQQAVIVDWSEVGIGCPFTEISQFMVSNTSVEFRRKYERMLFEEYYSQLVQLGVDSSRFPLDKCWQLYASGGIERWLQLHLILVAAKLPDFALLWFSRQVEAFLQDHFAALPQIFSTVYCLPPL